MSKQKRTAPVDSSRAEQQGPGIEHDALGLGNQALQAQLASEGRGPVPFDVVRDAAFPLVERAVLSLQLEPRGAAEVSRFVEILERSHLPEERRALLVDRIQTDQAVAEGIGAAVQRWFAADTAEVRAALEGTLDAVFDALHGHGDAASWTLPDGAVVSLAADALEGGVSGRAEALVRELADHTAIAELGAAEGASVGEAVRGFCADVQLALQWDEEEEEERDGDYAAEESV